MGESVSEPKKDREGFYPFSHPEIKPLFRELLATLVGESDRGAVLIGASHVEEQLQRFFESFLPGQYTGRRRKEIFGYGGPLGSYSARVEMAYALRLIPRGLYLALHALRRMRNDVAHRPEAFRLRDQQQRLDRIFAIGPHFVDVVKSMALEMMMDYKTHVVMAKAREIAAEDEWDPGLKTREEVLDYFSESPELLKDFENQLPQWQMVVGISMICGMLVWHRERAARHLGPSTLWGDFDQVGA